MHRRTAVRGLLAALTAMALAATLPAGAAGRGARPGPPSLRYTTYAAPDSMAPDAGEPSVGVSWKSGAVFLQAGLQTDRLDFSAGAPSWTDVSSFNTSLASLDPIGFTDSATGRTFVSQLTAAGSLLVYSDDDDAHWSTSQGSGLPAGIDHQSVGGGPYPPELGLGAAPLTTYPDAVYYCSQAYVTALCARSDTGGMTFGAGVPIYTSTQCDGLHGHVKVAPDGTVYVPNASCGGMQAVAVSTDAGQSWSLRTVTGSTSGDSDPSVAIGRDGTVYFAYVDAHGGQQVQVSRDRGLTWTLPTDVGAPAGLADTLFPAAVAGDGDRAAVAFVGTTTGGDPQDPDFGKDATKTQYVGASYALYVATTFDRGRTWQLANVTGGDPVQRGRICTGGTACTGNDRNLLDFLDAGVDRQGRVLVAWADGCTGACVTSTTVTDNPHSALGRVTRQSGGLSLYRTPPPVVG